MSSTPNDNGLVRPLPELELEVMKTLWKLETGTVADVKEKLDVFRPLAYTTIMTVLDRLARKGAVTRKKQGRGYLYRPAISTSDAREVALDRLLNDYFNNSVDRLADFLRRSGQAHGTPMTGKVSLDSALL